MKHLATNIHPFTQWTALLLIVAIASLTRLTTISTFQTADEPRWQARVSNFADHLAHFEFDQLIQQPHPGITTLWLAAPTNHYDWGYQGKVSLITSQIVLILITAYVYRRLWGPTTGLLIAFLLAINPFLIAHTRVLAMDSLLAHFLVLTLGTLLLWHHSNQTRYLILAAVFTAASWLSKLPGSILIPISLALIAYHYKKHWNWRSVLSSGSLWTASFIITSILILPTIITDPFIVYDIMRDFFASPDYTELHSSNHWYYLRTIIFFTTPLHLALPIILSIVWKHIPTEHRFDIKFHLLAAFLFIIIMTAGSKYGDRYVLSSILILDAVMGYMLIALTKHKGRLAKYFTLVAIILITWQLAPLPRLHPYYLAYVNPVTKPAFGQSRLGWGEGLDLAADYLNNKPDAQQLTIASYYPNQLRPYFSGRVTDLHNWEDDTVDYALVYRAALDRGLDSWETDVINQLGLRTPEHIIKINGLEYIWIYKLSP